jgi:hypothetical protein
MAALIALAALGLFAAGVTAGIVGVVSVAIRQEEGNLTLTRQPPNQVTLAGRWLNGVYVRVPRGTINEANLDGSNPQVITGQSLPDGVAFGLSDQRFGWGGPLALARGAMDGGSDQSWVRAESVRINALAVDNIRSL